MNTKPDQSDSAKPVADQESKNTTANPDGKLPEEIGGRDGPEPTRYGDWEKNGIISDF